MTTSVRARQQTDIEEVCLPNDTIPRHASYEQGGVGLPRALTRWLGPNNVRNPDRVYTAIFVVAVVLVGTAANLWPMGATYCVVAHVPGTG